MNKKQIIIDYPGFYYGMTNRFSFKNIRLIEGL